MAKRRPNLLDIIGLEAEVTQPITKFLVGYVAVTEEDIDRATGTKVYTKANSYKVYKSAPLAKAALKWRTQAIPVDKYHILPVYAELPLAPTESI